MKRKITQLAKGIIDAKTPEIRVLTASVDATVLCGQQGSGELSLSSGNGVSFRGLVYADDDRIEIADNSYAGTAVRIPYVLHAEDLRENTELSGKFALVTNAGDFEIPYHFHICRPILMEHVLPQDEKALGELAEQDPDMCMKLFQSEVFLQMQYGDFMTMPMPHQQRGHGLLRWSDPEHSSDEFE